MGTWFGTDALTQLAIRDGDKARLFFLLPRKGYRGEALGCGFSGSDELWAPVGAPLAGRYDGYGRIDRLERGFALDFMADWASRGFASGSLALSKDASPEKGERDDKSIENVVKWTERGWIEVRTLTGGGPLCGMLVLESVYRALRHVAQAPRCSSHAFAWLVRASGPGRRTRRTRPRVRRRCCEAAIGVPPAGQRPSPRSSASRDAPARRPASSRPTPSARVPRPSASRRPASRALREDGDTRDRRRPERRLASVQMSKKPRDGAHVR